MTQLPFPADEKVIRHMKSRLGFGAYLGANCHRRFCWTSSGRTLRRQMCRIASVWMANSNLQLNYFAAQCMAAELSTGVLAMLAIQSSKESVSLLVTNMGASLERKPPTEPPSMSRRSQSL